jgi:hypothetical protein
MQTQVSANNYRFNSLVETIVTSPQFLNERIPVVPEPSMAALQPGKTQ